MINKIAQEKKNRKIVPIHYDPKIIKMSREGKLDLKKVGMGKRNRAAGTRFELKVRKDLEEKGWIVSKWMNNISFFPMTTDSLRYTSGKLFQGCGKLIPAKHRFRGPGIPMAIGTGFPDFIAFRGISLDSVGLSLNSQLDNGEETKFNPYVIIGVEVKSNGILDKKEKEKCNWLIKNKIFSKILIASKGEKRGEIKYKEVKHGN